MKIVISAMFALMVIGLVFGSDNPNFNGGFNGDNGMNGFNGMSFGWMNMNNGWNGMNNFNGMNMNNGFGRSRGSMRYGR